MDKIDQRQFLPGQFYFSRTLVVVGSPVGRWVGGGEVVEHLPRYIGEVVEHCYSRLHARLAGELAAGVASMGWPFLQVGGHLAPDT